jgi:hypothetical protein
MRSLKMILVSILLLFPVSLLAAPPKHPFLKDGFTYRGLVLGKSTKREAIKVTNPVKPCIIINTYSACEAFLVVNDSTVTELTQFDGHGSTDDAKLVGVKWIFPTGTFSSMRETFIAKYGPPSIVRKSVIKREPKTLEEGERILKDPTALDVPQVQLIWWSRTVERGTGVEIDLREHATASNVDDGGASFRDIKWMKKNVEASTPKNQDQF